MLTVKFWGDLLQSLRELNVIVQITREQSAFANNTGEGSVGHGDFDDILTFLRLITTSLFRVPYSGLSSVVCLGSHTP